MLGSEDGRDEVDGTKLGSFVGLVEAEGIVDGCSDGASDNVSVLCACCVCDGTGAAGTGSNGAGIAGAGIAMRDGAVG